MMSGTTGKKQRLRVTLSHAPGLGVHVLGSKVSAFQVIPQCVRRPVDDIEHPEHEGEEDAGHDVDSLGSSRETGQPFLDKVLIGVRGVYFAAFQLLAHGLWHHLWRHPDPRPRHPRSCPASVGTQQWVHGADHRHERLL